MTLTADELLAGSSLTHEVDIPADLLGEGVSRRQDSAETPDGQGSAAHFQGIQER